MTTTGIEIATLVAVTGIAMEKILDRLNCYNGIRQARLSCCSSCCEIDILRNLTPSNTHNSQQLQRHNSNTHSTHSNGTSAIALPPNIQEISKKPPRTFSSHYINQIDENNPYNYSSEEEGKNATVIRARRRSSTEELINNTLSPPSDSNCYKLPFPSTIDLFPQRLQQYLPSSGRSSISSSRRSSIDETHHQVTVVIPSPPSNSPQRAPSPTRASSPPTASSPSHSHAH